MTSPDNAFEIKFGAATLNVGASTPTSAKSEKGTYAKPLLRRSTNMPDGKKLALPLCTATTTQT